MSLYPRLLLAAVLASRFLPGQSPANSRASAVPLTAFSQSLEALAATRDVARRHDLSVHLDGARIFNAALATGSSPARIAAAADSVTFCLSKGLSCPAGSLLCGSREFIAGERFGSNRGEPRTQLGSRH